uniref:Uncharacterized protein n=1 Tax=Solanum lycopersicum TaxID=4081 RepID=A0A3Q7GJ25_SOLLC
QHDRVDIGLLTYKVYMSRANKPSGFPNVLVKELPPKSATATLFPPSIFFVYSLPPSCFRPSTIITSNPNNISCFPTTSPT